MLRRCVDDGGGEGSECIYLPHYASINFPEAAKRTIISVWSIEVTTVPSYGTGRGDLEHLPGQP